jgi:hypothetical protein
LFIIEAGIKQEKVSSEKVIGLITPALRGNALQTLKRFVREKGDKDWPSLKKRLQEQFRSADIERKLRRDLQNLKQRDKIEE